MADEVALNIMGKGYDDPFFMVTRSTGLHSGNWYSLEECLIKALLRNQSQGRLDYYKGRSYVPIAGKPLIQWSDE